MTTLETTLATTWILWERFQKRWGRHLGTIPWKFSLVLWPFAMVLSSSVSRALMARLSIAYVVVKSIII
jgi:hypothetical protein